MRPAAHHPGAAADPYPQEVPMGLYLMPMRDTPDDDLVNDYVIWSTISDGPVLHGTRAEVIEWWTDEFGRQGRRMKFDYADPFALADASGSDSGIGNGWWGDALTVPGPRGMGSIPRDQLTTYIRADRAARAAMVHHFRDEEEDQS